MTKEEAISLLEQAQDILFQVYNFAVETENSVLENNMENADGCICDGLDSLDYGETFDYDC